MRDDETILMKGLKSRAPLLKLPAHCIMSRASRRWGQAIHLLLNLAQWKAANLRDLHREL